LLPQNRGMENNQIILIDDDIDDLELTTSAIVELGYKNRVRSFNKSVEALKYLETTPYSPSIVICDINMPVMGGMELRKHVFNNEKLRMKTVPFVFLSTSYLPSEIQKGYEMFIQGYFKKQQTMDALKKTVSTIMDYWESCCKP